MFLESRVPGLLQPLSTPFTAFLFLSPFPRLALNSMTLSSWVFCLSHPCVWMPGVHRHTWFAGLKPRTCEPGSALTLSNTP